MRKSQLAGALARRLRLRATRLANLTQRLSEAGLVHRNSGPPFGEVSMIEAARMLLVSACDEGLANAPNTVARFGALLGPGDITLETALGHSLSRPDSLPPACSSLELHCTDAPYAVLTVMTADGAATRVYGDLPSEENVDRTVVISGAALFGISSELSGRSAAEVDALLKGER